MAQHESEKGQQTLALRAEPGMNDSLALKLLDGVL